MNRALAAASTALCVSLILSPVAVTVAAPATTSRAATKPPDTATPEPTAEPTATTAPAKSITPLKLVQLKTLSKAIEFGALKTYEHDSGLFSIDVPENWTANDASTDTEAATYFLDPTKNALILARAVVVTDDPDDEAMANALKQYVETTFGKQKNYQAEDPKKLKNGDQAIGFSFDLNQSGKTYRMFGDAFEFKTDVIASTLVFISPKDQYEKIKKQAYGVMNTYKANPDAATSTNASSATTQDDIIGELSLYQHPSGTFEIQVPASWDVKDQSKTGQAVVGFVEPNSKAEIVAEVYKTPKSFTATALRDAVTQYANASYGKQDNLQVSDAEDNGLGGAKTTCTFDMQVNGDTVSMVAVLYVDKVPGAISFLRLAVPADSIDSLQDKLDQIGASYKVSKNPKI